MANPYHRGTPNYVSDPSISAGIAGGAQRTSYASIASGSAGLGSTGRPAPGIALLLNSANDGPPDFASGAFASTRRGSDDDISFAAGQRSSSDAERRGFTQSGAARQPWPGSHLQNFSRAFETFMGKDYMPEMNGNGSGNGAGQVPRLLKPSYLDGSLYYQKLEEVWKQRLLAQRESNANQSAGVVGLSSGNASSQMHSSKIATGSHRGMTYEVVEKAPQLTSSDDETTVTPLPSRWNKDDKYGGLEVLGVDGFEVKYTGHRQSGEREHEACSIRTDTYMPPQCGIYYFEVTVLNRKRDDTTIAIGFSGKAVSLARVPGWEPESWGYHGDDGNIYAAQNIGKPYGQPFGPGDCIGCGVNFNTGMAFFTRNGRHLGTAFREVKGKLFPSVGLKRPGEHIWANFGQVPFQFDIDRLVQNEKLSLIREIDLTDTSSLAPGRSEADLSQLLVLQFLQHDGYIETARAFAEEVQAEKRALTLNANAVVKDINVSDDEDANRRQRIRRSILEGDIDRALKLTTAYYPQVLKENEQVYFRLRCRKFIEMIRRDADSKNTGKTMTNGNDRNGNHVQDSGRDDQSMELDGSSAWEVQMDDTDDGTEEALLNNGTSNGTQNGLGGLPEAIAYGRELRAEFGGDQNKEVERTLDEVFSLVAYPDPWAQPEVAHLLDRSGRVAVAEELNSAILRSLGKSSRAALEILYAQTSVLLEELQQNGGPGAFITMDTAVHALPRSSQR